MGRDSVQIRAGFSLSLGRERMESFVHEQSRTEGSCLPRAPRTQGPGLMIYTWGNVSAIDRDSGEIAIKPSGIPCETLRPEDIVVIDLAGKVVEGHYKPSSDTPTHLRLYSAFAAGGRLVHTHSLFASAWGAGGPARCPCLGATPRGLLPGLRALHARPLPARDHRRLRDGDRQRDRGDL